VNTEGEPASVLRELRGLLADAPTWSAIRTAADAEALGYVIDSAARRGASADDLEDMLEKYPMLADRLVKPKRRRWLLGRRERRARDRPPPPYEQLQLIAIDGGSREIPPSRGADEG